MDATKEHTDLSYWVYNVLPYEADRNANAYLVYPQLWIVVPVLTPNASDKALIYAGKSFSHYSYLENGALHYFGQSPSQGKGNMSIAAHSSYYKNDIGRYKTIFQVLPISRPWDTVWYFEKNSAWSYDLYEYEITESYETDEKDVSILSYNNDGNTYLTTYGCYPIGSNEKRRVNKSILKRTTLEHSPLNGIQHIESLIQSPPQSTAAPIEKPKTQEPTTLIGKSKLDSLLTSSSPLTPPITVIHTSGTPQDVASRIAVAMKWDIALGVAPIRWQSVTTAAAPKLWERSTRSITTTADSKPTKQLSIEIWDTRKVMKNVIVATTTLGAWDLVDIPTIVNPLLATNTCHEVKENSIITLGEKTKSRDQVVFQGLMLAYGLTSFANTDDYKPENGLKRYEAAKILVTFAKNILCRQQKATYTEWMYTDIQWVDATLVPYIKQAYEYGIMKGGKWKFRPLDRISKQEFIAGLMRIVLNSYLTEKNDKDWYKNYETVFADYGLQTLVLDETMINRYDMSKIFYKLYYNDQYTWTKQWYILPSTIQ
jgi:hypothetical protein